MGNISGKGMFKAIDECRGGFCDDIKCDHVLWNISTQEKFKKKKC